MYAMHPVGTSAIDQLADGLKYVYHTATNAECLLSNGIAACVHLLSHSSCLCTMLFPQGVINNLRGFHGEVGTDLQINPLFSSNNTCPLCWPPALPPHVAVPCSPWIFHPGKQLSSCQPALQQFTPSEKLHRPVSLQWMLLICWHARLHLLLSCVHHSHLLLFTTCAIRSWLCMRHRTCWLFASASALLCQAPIQPNQRYRHQRPALTSKKAWFPCRGQPFKHQGMQLTT